MPSTLNPPRNSGRIRNLDAARGAAMALVCLSHFTAVFFRQQLLPPPGQTASLPWPLAVGMIASPTFVAISGTLLGLLFVLRRESFGSLRLKLIDRSLFVLTVAHVLIAASKIRYEATPIGALSMTFMTDTIAVCVIVGSLLIRATSRTVRVALGVACFAIACWLIYAWTPQAGLAALAKDVLVGGTPLRVLGYSVPLLQWFGVYIACTAFGEYLGDLYRRIEPAQVERALLAAGLSVLAAGLGLRILGWYLAAADAFDLRTADYWRLFFSPWSKLPPSPSYVLFFGGLGMLLMWALTVANQRGHASWLFAQLATLGRCSLAVFTLQYYVYYVVLHNLPLPRTMIWPLPYAASLALLLVFARWWDRGNYNALLSVGLTHNPQRAEARKAAVATIPRTMRRPASRPAADSRALPTKSA